MHNPKVLFVTANKIINKLLFADLKKEGIESVLCISTKQINEILENEPVNLAIIDVTLPTVDGFELCKKIRHDEQINHIPIMVISDTNDEISRTVAFEIGVDDYIVKPFTIRELYLRIKRSLKQTAVTNPKNVVFQLGELSIDLVRHRVILNHREIPLTKIEFGLLTTLANANHRVLSRKKLLNDVWRIKSDVNTRTVDMHISALRTKLGDDNRYIETIRGFGYRMREKNETRKKIKHMFNGGKEKLNEKVYT